MRAGAGLTCAHAPPPRALAGPVLVRRSAALTETDHVRRSAYHPTKAPVAEAEAKPAAVVARRMGAKTRKKTKSEAMIGLLTPSRRATLDEMMTVTGWQAHSVRGFIAGSVKKKLGRSVTSETNSKGRIYRVVVEAG